MNPEDGVLIVVEDVLVKLLIFFRFDVLGIAVPEGFLEVYLFVFEHDGPHHEVAVALQNLGDLGFFGVIGGILVKV